MHKGRGQCAPLDASSSSRSSHSTPCFALPLCALLAVQRVSVAFCFPHTDTSTGLLCVREKLFAQRAPGSNCLLQTDSSKLGAIGLVRVLYLFRGGRDEAFAMRWTYQYLK
ncbi:hypothetical protein PFLUV_G00031170 [Perca fluviatilis]|uniref:Uncharacterized protein n=1 Tax=Perca fluviatilis TaxID=8168 RepID=A0A6A5ET80_PERFL|nr:hypothetical protein PFLUV_G00031170 [Perca fluviatilis]